jgi:hypothetical protein
MGRHDQRKRVRSRHLESLEPRCVLSSIRPVLAAASEHHALRHDSAAVSAETLPLHFPAVVPGNKGLILHSQIDPFGNNEVGYQWRRLALGGPLTIHTDPSAGPEHPLGPVPNSPFIESLNAGSITQSQFVRSGYPPIGLQLKRVHLGGGLTIDSHDESSAPAAPASGNGGVGIGIVGAPINSGNIKHSQVNVDGFGKTGVQLNAVRVRGNLTIRSKIFELSSTGQAAAAGSGSGASAPPVIQSLLNSGLIQNSQLNKGGFGDNGLQWDHVRVGGSAGVGVEKYEFGGGAAVPPPASSTPPLGDSSLQPIDTMNIGLIRDTQFNAGGFGDIGMQWKNVRVRKNAGTSDNNLSIQPEVNGVGPITVNGIIFGQQSATIGVAQQGAMSVAAKQASQAASPATPTGSKTVSVQRVKPRTKTLPIENDSLNSGRITNTQFTGGGFGDIGAQWRGVTVGGSATAVHNSLSIQPENEGQGLITVTNVRFPSTTPDSLTPPPNPQPGHRVAPLPIIIPRDGNPVPHTLSIPTLPRSRRYAVNEATNSGNIRASQVSDGGYGDIGLQWAHVRVGHDVKIVHNSLSVHPEGSQLAGVIVSNVAFGDPITSVPSTASASVQSARAPVSASHGQVQLQDSSLNYVENDRFLNHKQFFKSPTPDILMIWNHAYRNNGLMIVHNLISVPAGAPVHLSDIRFLGVSTAPTPVSAAQLRALSLPSAGSATAGGLHASAVAPQPQIKVSATNSGIIRGNQFSDGGFSDIGLQWRNVHVSGSVFVVHNTLAVNVVGTPTGPITISNVTFNSGALKEVQPTDTRIVAPPNFQSFVHTRPSIGTPLRPQPNVTDTSTNSGILLGGQFLVGGKDPGHIGLQWRKVGIRGSVTVIDNVLSIQAPPVGTGPITIQHVTFA